MVKWPSLLGSTAPLTRQTDLWELAECKLNAGAEQSRPVRIVVPSTFQPLHLTAGRLCFRSREISDNPPRLAFNSPESICTQSGYAIPVSRSAFSLWEQPSASKSADFWTVQGAKVFKLGCFRGFKRLRTSMKEVKKKHYGDNSWATQLLFSGSILFCSGKTLKGIIVSCKTRVRAEFRVSI